MYLFIGNIYTVKFENPWVESIIIEGEKIVFIGNKEDAFQYVLNQNKENITEIIELSENEIMLPGFQDAHVHPLLAGIQFLNCNLQKEDNVCVNNHDSLLKDNSLIFTKNEELNIALNKIYKYYHLNKSSLQWIIGSGWESNWFNNLSITPAKLLDIIIPDKPAIFRSDGHAAWANTKAMQKAKIISSNNDFFIKFHSNKNEIKGIIELDKHGNPNGIFHEEATNLIYDKIPSASFEFKLKALEIGLNILIKYGITAFQEALVKDTNLTIYKKLYLKKWKFLPKASLSLCWKNEKNILNYLKLVRQQKFINRLRINTVKLFLDGVIKSQTAYLHQPYINQLNNPINIYSRGISNYSMNDLKNIFSLLDKEDFQIHCHSVGSNATSNALEAFQYAFLKNENCNIEKNKIKKDRRHHLAHLQIVRYEDIKKFKELGIIANFQPFWCKPDIDMKLCEFFLGKDIYKNWLVYPIKQMKKNGIKIAFGSDWPVTTVNPLSIIEVSVTHQNIQKNNEKQEIWLPSERITTEEAIECYTIGSSFINCLEKETGTIEHQKNADLIILSKNIFKIPSNQIHTIDVLMTMIDGMILYEKKPLKKKKFNFLIEKKNI